MTSNPRRKVKRNLKNLLVNVPSADPDIVSYGYEDDVQTFLDAYGETVLGDGQDPEAYQEYRQLDLEGKWDFVKEYDGKSEEELTNDFWKWKYNEDLTWDEDSMPDDYYNLMELEDEEPEEKNDADPEYKYLDGTPEIHDEGFNKFMDETYSTNLSSIAKNIIANDLGRKL